MVHESSIPIAYYTLLSSQRHCAYLGNALLTVPRFCYFIPFCSLGRMSSPDLKKHSDRKGIWMSPRSRFRKNQGLTRFEVVHLDWIRLDVSVQKLAALTIRGRSSVESLTALDIYSHGTFSGLVGAEHEDEIGIDMDAVFKWFRGVRCSQIQLP